MGQLYSNERTSHKKRCQYPTHAQTRGGVGTKRQLAVIPRENTRVVFILADCYYDDCYVHEFMHENDMCRGLSEIGSYLSDPDPDLRNVSEPSRADSGTPLL
jgi:hypothetical protein